MRNRARRSGGHLDVAGGSEDRGRRHPDAWGHFDHVGSLPLLFETGFDRPLYATRTTLDIADLVVSDSIHIGGGTDEDIRRFRLRLRELGRPIPYDQSFSPPGFEGTVAFREAGHILGSASVEVTTARSRVICSGDLGRPDSPILRDYCSTWKAGRDVDLVILETTYGDCEHAHGHGDIEGELERIILRTVNGGGHLLVPAFAIGRTQTLLYYLNSLVESGRIPRIPVALDTPMGLKVTELPEHSRALFDRQALDRIARGVKRRERRASRFSGRAQARSCGSKARRYSSERPSRR